MAEEKDLTVRLRGLRFTGWEEIKLTRSIVSAAGAFELKVKDVVPFAATPGQEVEVFWGDTSMLRGYVDGVKMGLGPSAHEVTVAGRDKTGDLVDCSIDPSLPQELEGRRVFDIVQQIAAPHGITVEERVADLTPIDKFSLDPSETGYNAILRAVRMVGLLAFADGAGGLVLDSPGGSGARVELFHKPFPKGSSSRRPVGFEDRGNVEQAELVYQYGNRFGVYVVRGQQRGTDNTYGAQVAQVEGRAVDAEIPRFRPLLVLPEGAVDLGTAKARAQWEATVRAAESTKLKVTVSGWDQWKEHGRPGPVWAPNQTVRVSLPELRMEREKWLIQQVAYTRSHKGTTGTRAELELVRPDAYTLQEEIPAESNPLSGYLGEWDAFGPPAPPDVDDDE